MTAAVANPAGRLCAAYAEGADLLLLFDYDGTLVPIVDHPRLARPSPELLVLLQRLARLPGVHLGVISGRQHLELQTLLPAPEMFLAGTSGLELDFRGISVTHPQAGNAMPALNRVADELSSLSDRYPGAWVERKRVGLTLHYRDVPARDTQALRRHSDLIVGRHIPRLRTVDGCLAVEITPNLGWTKGTAARMFLDSLPSHARVVLYAGDNANDLEAMQFAVARRGITIGVGPDAPAVAEFRMPSAECVVDWLTDLAVALSRVAHTM